MTAEQQNVLRTARTLLAFGHPIELILASPVIPPGLRDFVKEELERDANIELTPARMVVADASRPDWLVSLDRSTWYYWPTLRLYLLRKGWSSSALRSLDDSSDSILRQIAPPHTETFDVRGLVLGFVQSGKTANFTALAAKAADAGYRLVVVLSGIDNGLRRQTNIRLKRELVGYADGSVDAVPLPPMGNQWHEFTRPDLNGDFQPGYANHAALQGSQPVLLVVKKNGPVLRRLAAWLDGSPEEVRHRLPVLIIDDEADQASVDTRGSRQVEDDPPYPDYEPPSVINGLIRGLIQRFDRVAYVAYTATPFANILIPHDTVDPAVGNDLYPKDFIVDLPQPNGYFGAEQIFGRMDVVANEEVEGLDVIRHVPDADLVALESGQLPESLELALLDFVLAASARAQRNRGPAPATMLIHTSQLIATQAHLNHLVSERFAELKDEWRYQRHHGLRERLLLRWDSEFRPVTRSGHLDRDATFETIEPQITPIFEAVQVREINSATGDVLDYDREPDLKAIAIGGNRLSRGLTLEGLQISYFLRPSATYDTLMQMGRWFGFREGYEDLTRIWTTAELAGWFATLAFVEHRLRQDIEIYEVQGLTPREVGMRIWQHPTMQITSPLKRRFATATMISQSYSLALEQTFKFALSRPEDLAVQAEANLQAVRQFVGELGAHDLRLTNDKGPVWSGISPESVIAFLEEYRMDDEVRSMSIPLICAYVRRLVAAGDLVRWIVAIRGRKGTREAELGAADWNLPTGPVAQISRSRLKGIDSVGVIVDPEDEAVGIQPETELRGHDARVLRPSEEGLLLLYPISRYSGQNIRVDPSNPSARGRRPLYEDANGPLARDLVGLAISFPRSRQQEVVEAYLEGTVRWRPIE